MSHNIDLLVKKASKEGELRKSASSKGRDYVRNKSWNTRWFVLRGRYLHYYKKKSDSKPKGTIELKHAHVSPAEEKTGRRFTIRIAQTRQIFNYLQAETKEDYNDWLFHLKQAASGEGSPSKTGASSLFASGSVIGNMRAWCTFGGVVFDDKHEPVSVVVCFDDVAQRIDFARAGRAWKTFKINDLHKCACAISSTADDRSSLIAVTFDFIDTAGAHRFVLYMDQEDEALQLQAITHQVSSRNYSLISEYTSKKAVDAQIVSIRFKDVKSISGAGTYAWIKGWSILTPDRFLFFANRAAPLPIRSRCLVDTRVIKTGQRGVSLDFHSEFSEGLDLDFIEPVRRDAWCDIVLALQGKLQAASQEHAAVRGGASAVGVEADTRPLAARDDIALQNELAAPQDANDASFLVAWGSGKDGQLGDRSQSNKLQPTLVSSLSAKHICWVAAGAKHTVAVASTGRVFVWGSGLKGQLGLGRRTVTCSTPLLLTSLLKEGRVVKVVCGTYHNLALSSKGKLLSWGSNEHGQLGVEEGYVFAEEQKQSSSIPHQRQQQSQSQSQSQTQTQHRLASLASGSNPHTQANCVYYPRHVQRANRPRDGKGPVFQVLDIAAGAKHSLAIVGDTRQLYVWGSNAHQQLGVKLVQNHVYTAKASVTSSSTCVPHLWRLPHASTLRVLMAGCGDQFTAVYGSDKNLYTFGTGDDGELGNGRHHLCSGPTPLSFFADHRSMQVARLICSSRNVFAVCQTPGIAGRMLFGWGQAMDNAFAANQYEPVQLTRIAAPLAITASHTHALVIDEDLALHAFGSNDYGELGSGKANVRGLVHVNARLAGEYKALQTACGDNFSVALMQGSPPAQLASPQLSPSPGQAAQTRRSLRYARADISIEDAEKQFSDLMSIINEAAASVPSEKARAGVPATPPSDTPAPAPASDAHMEPKRAPPPNHARPSSSSSSSPSSTTLAATAVADAPEIKSSVIKKVPVAVETSMHTSQTHARRHSRRKSSMRICTVEGCLSPAFDPIYCASHHNEFSNALHQPLSATPSSAIPQKSAATASAPPATSTASVASTASAASVASVAPVAPVAPVASVAPVAPVASVTLVTNQTNVTSSLQSAGHGQASTSVFTPRSSLSSTETALPVEMGSTSASLVSTSSAASPDSMFVSHPSQTPTPAASSKAVDVNRKDGAPLLPGWQPTLDKASGKIYYFHIQTLAVQWDRPVIE